MLHSIQSKASQYAAIFQIVSVEKLAGLARPALKLCTLIGNCLEFGLQWRLEYSLAHDLLEDLAGLNVGDAGTDFYGSQAAPDHVLVPVLLQ